MMAVLVVPDYFTPAMLGLKMDQEVLGELVKVKIPGVWQTMMDNNVTWTLVVSRWFICLYIDVLPVEVSGSVCPGAASREIRPLWLIYLFYLVPGLGSFCRQMNNRLCGKSKGYCFELDARHRSKIILNSIFWLRCGRTFSNSQSSVKEHNATAALSGFRLTSFFFVFFLIQPFSFGMAIRPHTCWKRPLLTRGGEWMSIYPSDACGASVAGCNTNRWPGYFLQITLLPATGTKVIQYWSSKVCHPKTAAGTLLHALSHFSDWVHLNQKKSDYNENM